MPRFPNLAEHFQSNAHSISDCSDIKDQLIYFINVLRNTLANSATSRSSLYSTLTEMKLILNTGNRNINGHNFSEITECSNEILHSLFESCTTFYTIKVFSDSFHLFAELDDLVPTDTSNPAELLVQTLLLQPQIFVQLVNQMVF